MNKLGDYNSLIFDCDGVVLNSNQIKTNSFRIVLKEYNKEAVEDFIDFHKKNGGISRYIKFDYFFKNILPKYSQNYKTSPNEFTNLLNNYSKECINNLCNSEVTPNLLKMRELTKNIPWMIVSGGDQNELIKVFKHKNISEYFNGGIFGSPDKKIEILEREIKKENIKYPALMFGDSKLDHEVSVFHKIDFIFVHKWSDCKDYKAYCKNNSIKKIPYLADFLKK